MHTVDVAIGRKALLVFQNSAVRARHAWTRRRVFLEVRIRSN